MSFCLLGACCKRSVAPKPIDIPALVTQMVDQLAGPSEIETSQLGEGRLSVPRGHRRGPVVASPGDRGRPGFRAVVWRRLGIAAAWGRLEEGAYEEFRSIG
jgi:hypothetical protein